MASTPKLDNESQKENVCIEMLSDTSAISSDRSDEDLVPAGYHWLRFKWMLFKDCCRHWHNRREFIFAMLMPSAICLFVVILRYQIRSEHITADTFRNMEIERAWTDLLNVTTDRQNMLQDYFDRPTYNTYVPRIIIAYAPDFEPIKNIMNEVYDKFALNGNPYAVFSTCDKLRKKMSTEYYLAGICFNEDTFKIESESIHKVGIYPNRLKYTIIVPTELRRYLKSQVARWHTRYLYAPLQDFGDAKRYKMYLHEGVLMIQKKISEAYIHLVTNTTDSLDTIINLRRFPVAEHYYDPLSRALAVRLSLLLVMAYIPSVVYLLKTLVYERSSKLDGVLEVLDVTPFIQFYSWFIFTLASMSIGTIILLFILKIPWNNGFGVFNRSSFTCLFTLFTAFNINTLSFCYMMSKFFQNPKVAVSAAPIFWILFYLPFMASTKLKEVLPFTSLFGNSAFANSLLNIFYLEYYNGLQWSNFFKHADLRFKYFSVGTFVLIMCGVTIMQSIIGICVPRINNLFHKVMKLLHRNKSRKRANSESTRYSKTIILEVRATYKTAAVEVISVTVERGEKNILDEVSFSLYEDEITILMGHNGSGKTTLLQVIAGLKRIKSGKVVFKDDRENKEYGNTRDFVGVCFTDTLLFDSLSVKHQLMLFGRLKGLHSSDLKKEVKKYLDALELEDERYTLTGRLTCGQRTKLAVSCALIGNSKIVLLDDVVLKLDVRDYQLIWNLLEKEKFGRCILASTNLSCEPELHADNIVMLAQGRLKCTGTPQFLKSMYCFGCHLLIAKSEHCNSEEVTKLISMFIPDIVAVSDLVLELLYHIETSNIETVESVFTSLEAERQRLGIINISIIETPIEELFCKLGAERPAYDDRKRYIRILNGQSITLDGSNDDLLFMKTPIRYKINAFQRLYNQWYAMFYKFLVFYWTHKSYFPILLFIVLICVFFCAGAMLPRRTLQPTLLADIRDYKDSIVLLSIRTDIADDANFIEMYKQHIYWKNSNIKVMDLSGASISDYILNHQRQNQYNNLKLNIILGLTLQKHITVWFNGYLPHSAPLSLNIVHNAILRHYLQSPDPKISVALELLPEESLIPVGEIYKYMGWNMGCKLAILLSLFLCYLISIQILNFVSERSTEFQSLQRIAGLSGFNYWITMFIFDMLKYCVVTITFILAAWIILPSFYTSPVVLRWCFALLFLLSAALTSTNYFLSLFFNDSFEAYLTITTIQSIGVACYVLFTTKMLSTVSSRWMILLRIFPLYSFSSGFQNVYEHNIKTAYCENETFKAISLVMENCQKIPNCCEQQKLAVEVDAKYLWINIGISWLGILLYECRGFFYHMIPFDNYDRALDEHKRRHASDAVEVDNVTAEVIRVQSLKPRMRYYYTVICEKLGLIQQGKVLVDRLTFTISPGEMLGIVGNNSNCTNGLLNLIAGIGSPSFGRIYVNSVSLTDEHSKALTNIGYVPAINCLMPEMTCCQILKMFCILYAYPRRQISDICENLSNHFGFQSHYNVRLQHCSSGIRERISYSIAILKKPALLCIGSYTWSVDPHGRRQLYRILNALCKQGTAVAMTSVTNCFTEILCTRLAVMHNGQFLYIGQPSRIASDTADGYFVSMRMRKLVQTPQGVTSKVFFRLTAFMEKNFPSSKLVQEGTIIQYFIPRQSSTFAVVFKTLRVNSFQLNIENLSITSMNMSYIFGLMTEKAMRNNLK